MQKYHSSRTSDGKTVYASPYSGQLAQQIEKHNQKAIQNKKGNK